MDAITFLRDECGFGCGDPGSAISNAWTEIERLASQKEEAIRIADQALAHAKELSAALKCLIGATEPMASRERQVHAITMAVAALRGP